MEVTIGAHGKPWPLRKPGNVGPGVKLKCLVHSKALEGQDTLKIFLYTAGEASVRCIIDRSSLQVGRRT